MAGPFSPVAFSQVQRAKPGESLATQPNLLGQLFTNPQLWALLGQLVATKTAGGFGGLAAGDVFQRQQELERQLAREKEAGKFRQEQLGLQKERLDILKTQETARTSALRTKNIQDAIDRAQNILEKSRDMGRATKSLEAQLNRLGLTDEERTSAIQQLQSGSPFQAVRTGTENLGLHGLPIAIPKLEFLTHDEIEERRQRQFNEAVDRAKLEFQFAGQISPDTAQALNIRVSPQGLAVVTLPPDVAKITGLKTIRVPNQMKAVELANAFCGASRRSRKSGSRATSSASTAPCSAS